ncbi:telomeric repeat binding factor a [Genypterus blacodes]|uniref:telomeric repeat binding factor a n=1 Tax=Genypterus blacodes TaxID=154954 RepID=UPI003F75B956
MAAKDSGNSPQNRVESIVNRWLVDYYVFMSIELFKNEEYSDFCAIRDLADHVLRRPLECTDVMPTKVRVLQFLSRIIDGENLDLSFEADRAATPLESAITLLEKICPELTVPQQEVANVVTTIKEMLMVICIKKNEFEKAEEVLKHFPKGRKKAIFTELIGQKSQKHEILEQITFQRFKDEMLEFSQRLCSFTVPFLCKAAKRLISKRVGTEEEEEEEQENGPQPDEADSFQIAIRAGPCDQIIIHKTRLEAVYTALAAGSELQTFSQLEEETEMEMEQTEARKENISISLTVTSVKSANVESQQAELFLKDSCVPLEAIPADQSPAVEAVPQSGADPPTHATSPQRTRRQHTVAQLVMGPDSQGAPQDSPPSNGLDTGLDTGVRAEEPETVTMLCEAEDQQCPLTDTPITKPTRKRSRRSRLMGRRDSNSEEEEEKEEEEEEEEEDTHGSVASNNISALESLEQTKISPSKDSTESKQSEREEDPLGSVASFKTPVRKPRKRRGGNSTSNLSSSSGDLAVDDTPLDSSPSPSPRPSRLRSSTASKASPQKKGASYSKWKQLYSNAKESKETWSDEEVLFSSKSKKDDNNKSITSASGHRKKRWSDQETQMLREAVGKFGEGNWSKIKTYYPFDDRTNVNLKDRWRTMKNLKLA